MKKTNKTRKIAAMIAAMALAACAVAPSMAFAADVNIKVQTDGTTANEVTSITPDADKANHTYTAYQVFKGAYDSTSNNFKITGLGDDAGSLLTNAAFLAFRPSDADTSVGEALAKLPSGASNDEKAIAAAQAINGITNGSAKADELAEILAAAITTGGTPLTTTGADFAEGYYLVKDTYTSNADAASGNVNPDAVSKFILRVNSAENAGGITIIPKKSYPEVLKKVQENAKTTTDYAGTKTALQSAVVNSDKWNDVADYCIGEDVPFQLYGSMPETLADYDAYYYKFTDTLGSEFDQPKEVTVNVGSKTLTFTLNNAGTAYELPSADQLQASAATTETTYAFKNAATQSAIYAALKEETAYTSLSAAAKAKYIHDNWAALTDTTSGALKDLNFDSEADAITATTTDIPAVTASTTTDGNCRVTWDSANHQLVVSFENVKAYTGVNTSTIVTVNYSATLNTSAVIGLSGQENKVDLTYSNSPNVEYSPKNDDTTDIPGDTDTTPEDKVVVFTYEVDVNKVDADTKQKLEGAEFQLMKSGTAIKFIDNGDGTYTVADQDDATLTTVTTIKSDANGLFKIVGLDSGTYTLTETKAPDGYPTPTGTDADFELVLTAATTNNQAWSGTASDALTGLTGTLNSVNMTAISAGTVTTNNNTRGTNGGVEGTIQNSKTTTLPSTGGMGTTLFILGGGVTAAAAGIYLVSKKRAKEEDAQ